MLGHVSLSETPISSIVKILDGSAEMSGLASTASAGIGILAGVADISGVFEQSAEGAVVPDIPVTTMDFNFTKTSSAVFVKGTDQEIDINFTIDLSTVGTYQAEGFSTQSFNLTQTTVGELQFEDLSTQDSVEVFSDLTSSSGLNLNTETFTDLNVKTIEQLLQEAVAWTDLET